MPEPTRVRWATQTDLDAIPAQLLPTRSTPSALLLAERADGVIGLLVMTRLWGHVPFVELCRVLPDAQRQGVGRGLVAFVAAELRANGHRALLSSSQVDEPGPQAWHRRLGFVECGILTGVNEGVGEVFFRLDLADSGVPERPYPGASARPGTWR